MDKSQEKLRNLLIIMSKTNREFSRQEIKHLISQLRTIYQNKFRHLYSDIFHLLTLIYSSDSQYNLRTLSKNIESVYNEVINNEDYDEEFRASIQKLYDHVNLDINRLKYTETIAASISEKVNSQNTKTSQELNIIATKAEKMQKEYITILGIFSSIVITFVAGISFSTSVLSNIDKVSIYRLSFVMVLLAIFLFNFLYLLLEFINKINYNPISNPTINATGKSSTISSINGLLFIMLIIIIISWYVGVRPWAW